MKAILVIDEMPASCGECNLYNPSFMTCYGECKCILDEMPKLVEELLACAEDVQYKPKWCPLKPMVKPITEYDVKVSFDYDADYALGWNDCISTILKESQ